MKHFVVTIGREYGSCGAEIGRKLAYELGVPYYDRDLVNKAAHQLNVDVSQIEEVDETKSKKKIGFDVTYDIDKLYLSDKLIATQSKIIKNIANDKSCVIIGRCADYILKDRNDCLSILIYAPYEKRVQHIMNSQNVTKRKAMKILDQMDKKRRNYYTYVTGKDRDEIYERQIMFDSSLLSQEDLVDTLKNIVLRRFTD